MPFKTAHLLDLYYKINASGSGNSIYYLKVGPWLAANMTEISRHSDEKGFWQKESYKYLCK